MNEAVREEVLVFACEGEQLLAVLTPPLPHASVSADLADVAVVIIVGGPQYRAGSHRQYVQLAQRLAQNGVAALRFDTRGMGDSTGAQRSLEEIEPDVGAAIDALRAARPAVRRVVLWGLCGGASAALLYWRLTQDPRVQGMVLVNPWVRSEATLARTHLKHYYLKRLGQRDFWSKLFSGKVAGKAMADLLQNVRLARSVGNSSAAASQVSAAGVAVPLGAGLGAAAARMAQEDAGRPLQLRMAQAWQHHPGAQTVGTERQ